jgi:hypothetical protein
MPVLTSFSHYVVVDIRPMLKIGPTGRNLLDGGVVVNWRSPGNECAFVADVVE